MATETCKECGKELKQEDLKVAINLKFQGMTIQDGDIHTYCTCDFLCEECAKKQGKI